MRLTRDWWKKMFCILVLCLFIAITYSACGGSDQQCNSVVNVNSCTSSSTNIQSTTQAQNTTQANLNATAQAQATIQTNLDVTAREQATMQAKLDATTTVLTTQKDKNASIVSTADIMIPSIFFISVLALLVGIFTWASLAPREHNQSNALAGLTLGVITVAIVLLLIMTVIVFFG